MLGARQHVESVMLEDDPAALQDDEAVRIRPLQEGREIERLAVGLDREIRQVPQRGRKRPHICGVVRDVG